MNQSSDKALTVQLLCMSLGLVSCQVFGAAEAPGQPGNGATGNDPGLLYSPLVPNSPALPGNGALQNNPAQDNPAQPSSGAQPAEATAHNPTVQDSSAGPQAAAASAPDKSATPPSNPTQAIPAAAEVQPYGLPTGNIPRDVNLSAAAPHPAAKRNSRRWELANALRNSSGWNLFESQSYFIVSPIDNPLLIEGAKRRLDAMHERLLEDLPPGLVQHASEQALLRFLPDRASFESTGARRGTTAQWVSAENTLVCYDAGSVLQREAHTWPALQHVLVHEHLNSTLGISEVPSWLLYGLAARYESLRFRATPEGGSWEEPDGTELARALSEAVAGEGPMPLARLLAFNSQEFFGVNEFGSGAYRNLVLAHSFVSFCWDPGKGSEERAPIDFLETFTRSLADGATPARALEHARGSTPLRSIELAWRTWIERATGRPLPSGF